MAQRKRGPTIQSEECNIIRSVIKRSEEDAEQKYLTVPLAKANARAAEQCNASPRTPRTTQRMLKERDNCIVSGGLSIPGKTR